MLDDQSTIHHVSSLIDSAIKCHASDIHIESYANLCRIRFRINGILKSIDTITPILAARIIIRIKIMAMMNISERRMPQDGRFSWPYQGCDIDLRVNCCPMLHGEKLVLRILNNSEKSLDTTSLGMSKEQHSLFIDAISAPHGLVLVTGPTGSGKTVTLYSALHHLNNGERNITTVEDPVEMTIADINQANVNSAIGLTFPNILRAVLRQDPDIIMIGEIRDMETATIAMQAALTGHLVLSTLHASSATHAISRLQSMDIPTHYLTHSLKLIIGQRLVTNEANRRTGQFEFLDTTDTLKPEQH